ncbi:MAG: hypothetical protein ACLP2X_13980 [Syntrophobacteraceae bacterium]
MGVNSTTAYTLNQKIIMQNRLEKLLVFLDALIGHSDDGDEISKLHNEINVILPQEKASEFTSKYNGVLREIKADATVLSEKLLKPVYYLANLLLESNDLPPKILKETLRMVFACKYMDPSLRNELGSDCPLFAAEVLKYTVCFEEGKQYGEEQ